MATPSEPLETESTAAVPLVFPSRRTTSVNWKELKRIAEIIQGELDDAGELHSGEYESVFAMWQQELRDVADSDSVDAEATPAAEPKWYSSANDYWEDEAKCSLDDNGVLGGFAHISPADVADSREFIYKLALKRPHWNRELVVDCGAGIGRVTKNLLLPLFNHVDVVEQSERLVRGVPQYIGDEKRAKKLRHLYCMGLQDFDPAPRTYDLVWVQWVSSHLTDVDFVEFLKRCKKALVPHGWIAIKENVLLSGSPYEIDRDDSSMTRSDVYYKSIFRLAGLDLIAEQTQKNFPEDLYPVKMYALA